MRKIFGNKAAKYGPDESMAKFIEQERAEKEALLTQQQALKKSESVAARINFLDEAGGRPATLEEYADWLEVCLKRGTGGQVLPYFDFNGGSHGAYLIEYPAHVPTLHGAESLRLIVPVGVSVTHDDLGGNMLLMADGECRNCCPTLCRDMKEELERRGYSFKTATDPNFTNAVSVTGFPKQPVSLELPKELHDAIKILKAKKLTPQQRY